MTVAWIWLGVAIVFEASWVIGMRFTAGWSRLFPSVFVGVTYIGGLIPLSLAGKYISSSTLYAVWVGGGIVTVALVDTLYFREPLQLPKLVCLMFILTGAVGLKTLSGGH
jgi:quaternary ammonium compound-resistance protein SugE